MLSIWTASTMSIACATIKSFDQQPLLQRSRSCSAIVEGKKKIIKQKLNWEKNARKIKYDFFLILYFFFI